MALVVLEALAGNLTRQGFISELKAAGVPPTQYGDALDEVRIVVLHHETPATDRARELVSSAAGSYASAFNTTMLGRDRSARPRWARPSRGRRPGPVPRDAG